MKKSSDTTDYNRPEGTLLMPSGWNYSLLLFTLVPLLVIIGAGSFPQALFSNWSLGGLVILGITPNVLPLTRSVEVSKLDQVVRVRWFIRTWLLSLTTFPLAAYNAVRLRRGLLRGQMFIVELVQRTGGAIVLRSFRGYKCDIEAAIELRNTVATYMSVKVLGDPFSPGLDVGRNANQTNTDHDAA